MAKARRNPEDVKFAQALALLRDSDSVDSYVARFQQKHKVSFISALPEYRSMSILEAITGSPEDAQAEFLRLDADSREGLFGEPGGCG
jgi:hypothetical protein